jgi:hypothetical protein
VAAALVVLAAAGCGGGGKSLHPPDRLSDGSRPAAVPPELSDVDGAVVVGTRVIRGLELEQKPYVDCLADVPGGSPTVAVERVTADGRTLTFATPDHRTLVACDGAPNAREGSKTWCGGEVGRLENGRVNDPRLDLANCLTRDRRTVAYAFMQPAPGARWLVVDHDRFSEIYDARDPYAVRVSTTDGIDANAASAKFRIRSYDGAGKKIGDEIVATQVAG